MNSFEIIIISTCVGYAVYLILDSVVERFK